MTNEEHQDSHDRAHSYHAQGILTPESWIMCRHDMLDRATERWEKRPGAPWQLRERVEPRWVPPPVDLLRDLWETP